MERRDIHLEETSDEEEDFVEEVKPQGEVNLVILFKFIVATSSKPQSEVLMYDEILNAEEMIN